MRMTTQIRKDSRVDEHARRHHLEELKKAGAPDHMLYALADQPAGKQQAGYRQAGLPRIVNLKPGTKITARILGDAFLIVVHWLKGSPGQQDESFPCFAEKCRYCPGATRMYGYLPIAHAQEADGEIVIVRAVLALPKEAALELRGKELRGAKYEFWRRNKVSIVYDVLEERAIFEPPPWFDVRATLCARYHIESWPDQSKLLEPQKKPEEAETDEPPAVLPFKQEAS